MSGRISLAWMRSRINESNEGASRNRNLYPVQEQATLQEIWEQVDLSCTTECRCRKAGDTKHWKLKSGVTVEEFRFAFLRTFVDRCEHLSLLKALEKNKPEYDVNRYKKAYAVMQRIGRDWDSLSGTAAEYNRTLFCDNWDNVPFHDEWKEMKVSRDIYQAKMFCLLLPDTCVPFDSGSLVRILKCLGLPSSTDYFTLLAALREKFLPVMDGGRVILPVLRRLDAPDNDPDRGLAFDRRFISFPRPGFSYATGYLPEERPVSLVLDKCFYNPKGD